MAENQLIVAEEHSNLFGKALKNLQKSIFSSKGNFKGLGITLKRKRLVSAYNKFVKFTDEPDPKKREKIEEKYENAYTQYLAELDKCVTEAIYPRVLENRGTYDENKIVQEYLKIFELKEKEHLEYKYKRQRFLLDRDLYNVMKRDTDNFVLAYKAFYVDRIDDIYKLLLKNFSIKLMEKNDNNIYDEVFTELEEYILNVLPIKAQVMLEKTGEEQKQYKIILKESKKLERFKYEIDNRNRLNYINKNMLLLAISRDLFEYSLPLVVAEQCYIKLLKESRELAVRSDNFSKQEEGYKLVISLIELYNVKLLSSKTYWDDPKIREEYIRFSKEFSRISKLENIDYDEYVRQKESLFIYYDLKFLNRSKSNKYEDIKNFYRRKLKQLKGLRRIKNKCKSLSGTYLLVKD